jgi:hypothetical protein
MTNHQILLFVAAWLVAWIALLAWATYKANRDG